MQIEVEMSRMRLGERQDISPLKIEARGESVVDYLRHHFRDLVEAVLDLIEGGVDVRVQQLHCSRVPGHLVGNLPGNPATFVGWGKRNSDWCAAR